jgi:four helix bundle protein
MEDNRNKSFEDLEVWQSTRILVKSIYESVQNLKDYSFRDQITRASVSVINNIAEGHERSSDKEFIRFLKIAKGSCGEVRSMLIISADLNYLTKEKSEELIKQCYSISRQLSGFVKYLETKSFKQ